MKIRHYYVFKKEVQNKMKGSSLNKDNWSILREDEEEAPFCIEKDIISYEKNCEQSVEYKKTAELVSWCIKKYNFEDKKIISLGVGKGILEWHLKKLMPNIAIECTDYTERAILQLQKVFSKLDGAYAFDMLRGNYFDLDIKALFVMHRISTEFDLNEWYEIFAKMYDAGIENIIFIPTGLDTFKTMYIEKKGHLKNILCKRKDIFCGWLYTESEFKRMFRNRENRPMYIIEERIAFEQTALYLLKRNEK